MLKKIERTGTFDNIKTSNKPKALTGREKRFLFRAVFGNPALTSSQLCTKLSEFSPGKSFAASTIRRYCFKGGYKSFVSRKKPILTKPMILKRLNWCKEYIKKDHKFWDSVIFSDECKIECINYNGQHRVRRTSFSNPYLPKYLRPRVKHPQSLMIWGCFCSKGTGRLYFCDGKMNSDDYINVLESKLVPTAQHFFKGEPYVFQDDSAPIHRSQKTRKWIAEHNIEALPWPSNSPDLNPIENIWKILKNKVGQKRPTNAKQLKKSIVEVWRNEISSELCQSLVSSMNRRCNDVIKNNGGHTKY